MSDDPSRTNLEVFRDLLPLTYKSKRSYECRRCGGLGHNKRTCPVKIDPDWPLWKRALMKDRPQSLTKRKR